jgi:lipopolysaccharide biosynthesis regulator YciM
VSYGFALAALLPLAAAGGWYMGRQWAIRRAGQRVSRLSTTYFRGLNYLLNEQPDKAIELFLQIAHVDHDAVETQIALGHLFRRRGEVERAIRLHQGLISRNGISDEHKVLALLELGEDYMRAGLLDRAETLFTDLVRLDGNQDKALRHLLAIYQFERDWPKSIEFARRLEEVTGESCARLIAHFYCEMAEQERRRGDIAGARSRLTQASGADPHSVRAGMLEAAFDANEGNPHAAVRTYERIARIEPDYLPEILPPLLNCYAQCGESERARAFLAEMIERHQGVAPILAMTKWLEDHDGAESARAFLSARLRERPSVRGQAALIELVRVQDTAATPALLDALHESTADMLKRAPGYRCNRCGFSARAHHWQCPGCRSWGTVMPVLGLSLE